MTTPKSVLLLLLFFMISACSVGTEHTESAPATPVPILAEEEENSPTFGSEVGAQASIEPTSPSVATREDGVIQEENEASTGKITPETAPTSQMPISTPERIASDHILDFWWGDNSNMLFYTTPGQYWKYDVVEQSKAELSPESLLTQTPHPFIPVDFDGEVAGNVTSPSGDYVLYWITMGPTSTPSVEQGEQSLGGQESVLWIAEEALDEPEQIAQMPFCFSNYIWSQNEHVVLLIPDPLANCTNYRAIAVDLTSRTTKPLFPIEQFPEPIIVFNISPQGSQILYAKNEGLVGTQGFTAEILDIESLESVGIDFSPPILRGQWVDPDTLLISYFNGTVQTMSLLDLSNLSETELVTTDSLIGNYIFRERLSDNSQWIAFSTGDNVNSIDGLWLLELP